MSLVPKPNFEARVDPMSVMDWRPWSHYLRECDCFVLCACRITDDMTLIVRTVTLDSWAGITLGR